MQRLGAFTLIELLVVMGLLAILGSVGVFVGWPVIRSNQLRGDRDVLVTLLERARNQSLTNSNDLPHGVAITSQNYVGFEGASYATRDASKDVVYPRAGSLTVTGTNEILFNRFSGETLTSAVYLSTDGNTAGIFVNKEGTIDW